MHYTSERGGWCWPCRDGQVPAHSKADIQKPEPCEGMAALHLAAQGGNVPVVELLLSKGARTDARDIFGRTPVHLAAQYGERESVSYLLDHGADVNAKDKLGFNPLSSAAQEGHVPLIDLLVFRGADLNLANIEGATPLTMAAQNGYLEIVKFLAEKGAVVDQPANDGATALKLLESSKLPSLAMLRLLISFTRLVHALIISRPNDYLPCLLLLKEVTSMLSGYW